MKKAKPRVSAVFYSRSPADTRVLSKKLASRLDGGEIIFLYGPIGAGKTVFVQGLAAAMGIKSIPVSASFSLMRQYKSAKAGIFHIDLFRLEAGDMDNVGFEYVLEDPKTVIVVEWPEAADKVFPEDRLNITIELLKGDGRKIVFRAGGRRSAEMLKDFKRDYAQKK